MTRSLLYNDYLFLFTFKKKKEILLNYLKEFTLIGPKDPNQGEDETGPTKVVKNLKALSSFKTIFLDSTEETIKGKVVQIISDLYKSNPQNFLKSEEQNLLPCMISQLEILSFDLQVNFYFS